MTWVGDRPAARNLNGRAETRMHTTHHLLVVYYYANTTRPLHTLTVYYYRYTPKFPSHIVGVPSAGSFYRFKLLSRPL